MLFVPAAHRVGSIGLPFSIPKFPLDRVQPVEGVICHTDLPGTQGPPPDDGTDEPALPVFVKVTTVFWHTVSFGDILKAATAFLETLIPPICPGVSPHGFEIM